MSPKGGVGKSTLAANLAVYLRAAERELPILTFSLDDDPFLEEMLAEEPASTEADDVGAALAAESFAKAVRPGRFGVHFVRSAPQLGDDEGPPQAGRLRRILRASGVRGLVVIDTKSDLDGWTQHALAAADLTVVPVKDQASLRGAVRVFETLEGWGRPRTRARVVISLVDGRIQFPNGGEASMQHVLRSGLARAGLPVFDSFVSRSPKVEALATNPDGATTSILEGAAGSVVDGQLRALARELRQRLDALDPEPVPTPEVRPPGAGAPRRPSGWRSTTP
ncbi:MAG: ParA family protein [Myxococcota bacterium]